MIIDILTGLIFIIGMTLLLSRLYRKIPELAAIPDHAITEYLQKDSTNAYLFLVHLFNFRFFYRRGHYQAKFWNVATKLVFKIHIFLLRLDNVMLALLKRLRPANRDDQENGSYADYWEHLQRPKYPETQPKRTVSRAVIKSAPLSEGPRYKPGTISQEDDLEGVSATDTVIRAEESQDIQHASDKPAAHLTASSQTVSMRPRRRMIKTVNARLTSENSQISHVASSMAREAPISHVQPSLSQDRDTVVSLDSTEEQGLPSSSPPVKTTRLRPKKIPIEGT